MKSGPGAAPSGPGGDQFPPIEDLEPVGRGGFTGECEIVDSKVAGVAAQMGVCVALEAAAGEVLVSSTVKDLVAGSGIRFEDRGVHVLPGCGDWRLFAVQKGG